MAPVWERVEETEESDAPLRLGTSMGPCNKQTGRGNYRPKAALIRELFFYQSISAPPASPSSTIISLVLENWHSIAMASSSNTADLTADDVAADSRSVSDELDSSDEEGWEDVEPDDETQPVVGLFSDQIFPDVWSMLKDCKENHNFDLLKIQKDFGMFIYMRCLR